MNPWQLLPWLVPVVWLGYVVLQLALGKTWGRNGVVGYRRAENPRGYWLTIVTQVLVGALIVALLASRF